MADLKYNSFKQELLQGVHNFDSDTYGLMLVTDAYTPLATHSKRSDVTNEVVGTGYTTSGQALTGLASSGGATASVDANDVTWSSSTITARAAVLYKRNGGAASADELVFYFDFGSNQSSSNGDFVVQINTSGLLDIT